MLVVSDITQNPADEQLSLTLARQVIASDSRSLSDRDIGQLQLLLLDHLGCCYRGAHLPWGRSMAEWARRNSADGPAVVFATGLRMAAATAALVNATAAHGLELDDTHDESISHPGAAVIATALAVSQANANAAAAMLAAIKAGYEVTGRIGAACNAAAVVERGFHPTSLFAGFGAAATAAHLLGFDAIGLARAWGLVLSMAGGSMQFSQEAVGTTVKRLHGGLAAFHGALACDLVALGIAGPEEALEGTYGLLSMFGHDVDAARLVEAHRDAPEIHRVSFKPYPCCRFFHSTIDAFGELTAGFSIEPTTIQKITVGGPSVLREQHTLRRPQSEMAAQYSLPYALAASLVFGPRAVEAYSGAALEDPQLLDIADRVEVCADEELESLFPEHFGSWVEIDFVDGDSRRSRVLDSLGTPANPMSRTDLVSKFDGIVSPVNPDLSGEAVFEAIIALDDRASIGDLLERFSA